VLVEGEESPRLQANSQNVGLGVEFDIGAPGRDDDRTLLRENAEPFERAFREGLERQAVSVDQAWILREAQGDGERSLPDRLDEVLRLKPDLREDAGVQPEEEGAEHYADEKDGRLVAAGIPAGELDPEKPPMLPDSL